MKSRRFLPLVAAAVLSAIVATVLFTVLTLAHIEETWNIIVVSQALALARMTFIAALAHAIILGLPLFIFLRSISNVGIVSCALAGFLVGATPFAIFDLVSMFGLQSASTSGQATVVNGVPTLAGWIEYGRAVGSIGLFGGAGGVAFWAAMRLSDEPAEGVHGTDARSNNLRPGSWTIVSIAVILTCTAFLLPSVVTDHSCHNLFRDGRTSIGPQIGADIKLTADDWPTLRQMFIDFGAKRSLSFRGDQHVQHGKIMWRDLNLCNEAGVNIDALDQPWLTQINSPLADRGISFTVYELKLGSDWNRLARDLIDEIDTTWPDKTTFRGPDGKVVSTQEALRGRQ